MICRQNRSCTWTWIWRVDHGNASKSRLDDVAMFEYFLNTYINSINICIRLLFTYEINLNSNIDTLTTSLLVGGIAYQLASIF